MKIEKKCSEIMRNLIKYLNILFLSSVIIFNSCEEGVEIFSGDPSVPIIYCLLDPFDTVQYVRISKTYTIEQGTNPITSCADSLIYPGDIEVSLDRWGGGKVVEIILFEKTTGINKEQGLFPGEYNDLYRTFDPIYPETKYTLHVYLEDRGLVLSAETITLGELKVIDPFPLPQRKITLSSNMDYTIRCNLATEAWIYQTTVSFYYLEIHNADTLYTSFDWLQDIDQSGFLGTDIISFNLKGPLFYREMLDNIEENNDVKRISLDMTFIFYYGGKELSYYVESIKPSAGVLQEKPNYTNFTNCEGVFSSLSVKEINNIQLSKIFIDSIAGSELTRHLGFVNSRDSLY